MSHGPLETMVSYNRGVSANRPNDGWMTCACSSGSWTYLFAFTLKPGVKKFARALRKKAGRGVLWTWALVGEANQGSHFYRDDTRTRVPFNSQIFETEKAYILTPTGDVCRSYRHC